MNKKVTAFAPATIANVAVGFDILGFAIEGVGDEVTLSHSSTSGVRVSQIASHDPIPNDPTKNTATAALLALMHDERVSTGLEVTIKKGIPLSSGMGGSAASAVAAVLAADRFFDLKLSERKLLEYALAGEKAASHAIHADNIAPCLFGGLVTVSAPLTLPLPDSFHYIRVPVPSQILCVVVRPRILVETRHARGILKPQIHMAEHVAQTSNLAGFIASCFLGDLDGISRSMVDVIIEPQRSSLIPGFDEAKSVAIENGAMGFSIAGSGPSVFAWVDSEAKGRSVQNTVREVFEREKIGADTWLSPIARTGARALTP